VRVFFFFFFFFSETRLNGEACGLSEPRYEETL